MAFAGGYDEQVIIQIKADMEQLKKNMASGRQATQKFFQGFKKGILIAGATVAAITGVIKVVNDLVKAYGKQEAVEKKLHHTIGLKLKDEQATLKATKEAVKWAKERQRVTTDADEQLLEALNMAATFPITMAQAQGLVTRAQDISASTGQDLIQTTIALGKATEGQVGALKRYGISLSETTMETKDFNSIMADVDRFFKGQAETMANTVLGRWQQLAHLIGDAKERLGETLLPAMGKVYDMVAKLPAKIDRVAPTITKVVEALIDVGDAVWPLVEDVLPAIGPLLEGIAAAIKLVAGLLKPFTQALGQSMKELSALIGGMQMSDEEWKASMIRKGSGLMGTLSGMGVAKEYWQNLGFKNKKEAMAWLAEFEKGGYGLEYGQGMEALTLGELTSGEAEGLGGGGAKPPPSPPGGAGGGGVGNLIQTGIYAGMTVQQAMKDAEMMEEAMIEQFHHIEDERETFYDRNKWALTEMTEAEIEAVKKTVEATEEGLLKKQEAWQLLESNIRIAMNTVADLIKTGFEEGAAGAWKAIKELALKVATSAVIQIATKLLMSIFAPGATTGVAAMSWGKTILSGVLGGLGMGGQDNPINDQLIQRSFDHLGKFMVRGLENSLRPQMQIAGQPIYISADTDFVKYSVSRSGEDRVAMGRQFRKMIAEDQRTDI